MIGFRYFIGPAAAGILLVGTACAFGFTDQQIHDMMVGGWVTSPGHRAAYDIEREKLGYYAYEQYNNDGTGGMYIFEGRLCGRIFRIMPFSWRVLDGIITQRYLGDDGKPQVAREKFLSMTGDNAVFSDGHKPVDYQTRAPVCATS
jgi:hypothetical protein